MKRRTLRLPLAFALGLGTWFLLDVLDGREVPGAGGLAGARAEILASEYSTIQAALDALPDEGGVVRLPAGTFTIDRPLVLARGDVLLVGAGSATHIHNANAEGKPALVVRPPDYDANPRSRIWHVKLADFRITGNPESGHGIEATGVNEIFVDGLTVSEHGGDGIRLDNCYEDPRVADSLITYNKQAGLDLIACHDIVVAGNQFEENLDALRCADSFNLCMTGNCVDDHLRDGVVIEKTYGSVVSGNMIEECRGTAIVLDRDCYGITLSSNVIAHEMSGGIRLLDAHGCTVSANTFTIVQRDALVIGPKSGRIAVTGNTFADSFIGEGEVGRKANDRAASGLTLDGTSDVVAVGNLFSGLGSGAVNTRPGDRTSSRVLFSDNVLTESEADFDGLRDSAVTDNLDSEGRD